MSRSDRQWFAACGFGILFVCVPLVVAAALLMIEVTLYALGVHNQGRVWHWATGYHMEHGKRIAGVGKAPVVYWICCVWVYILYQLAELLNLAVRGLAGAMR